MRTQAQPLSGFMELLPAQQAEFDRIKQVIARAHHSFGFSNIDLPLIYRREVLLAKAGGDTEKQIYQLEKGDTKLALRFDHTVPLAAYVAGNQGNLTFPFKASQIGKNYRGERPQKGRFREFYQCDADVIGRGALDLAYDAEVIAIIWAIYKELNLGDFTIRIANRKLLTGFLQALEIGQGMPKIMHLIDNAEKITTDGLDAELRSLSLNDAQIATIQNFIKLADGRSNEQVLESLETLSTKIGADQNQASEFKVGLNELWSVQKTLRQMGITDCVKIDPMIVRGLDYYTGTVFETILNSHPEFGSIASGGRYDNLASNYSAEKFPGVGCSIGLSRLFAALTENNLTQNSSTPTADILVLPFSENEREFSFNLAARLRAQTKKPVNILLQPWKFNKKMEYAGKSGAKHLVVIGEQEVATGQVNIKDLQTGKETSLDSFLA